MTNIWKFLLVIFVSIFSFVQVSALVAPTWLILNEPSSDSLNISWDAVENSTGYYVYYSTESWIYDKQIDELIETTNAIISDLLADNVYYISVVSLDSEWIESANSLELEAQTNASEEVVWDPFSLKAVQVNSFSEIELTFSEALEAHPDASREFKVVNKTDSLDELLVVKTMLDGEDATKVVLTFDRDTLANGEYELTVIDIKSETGKNIESGIDGISSFSTPNEFIVEVPEVVLEPELVVEEDIDLNSADEPIVEDIPEVDLNAADPMDAVSWETLTEDDIEKNTISEANKTEELPNTWPTHILLFILTFMIVTLLFVFRFKRS